jgi:biopolymer transport protein ExbD
MKLSRTKEYNFAWLVLLALVDVVCLLFFFLLLGSNFILQPGISVSMPFSRFSLAPQVNQQIISITGGAAPAIYFRDQRVTIEELGPLLEAAKRDGKSVIIKADRLTPYETVIRVTNAALEHGVTSVALAATAPR